MPRAADLSHQRSRLPARCCIQVGLYQHRHVQAPKPIINGAPPLRRHANLKVVALDSQPSIYDPAAQSPADEQTMDYMVSLRKAPVWTWCGGSRGRSAGQLQAGPARAALACTAPRCTKQASPQAQVECLREDDAFRIVFVEYKQVADMEAAELAALAAKAVKVMETRMQCRLGRAASTPG